MADAACLRPIRFAAPMLALGLAAGCATPVLQSTPAAAGGAEGLVYALPKGQVLLQASRRIVDGDEVDTARKDAADAAAASKSAESAAKEAEKAADALDKELARASAMKVGADAISDLTRRRDLAKVLAALARTKADSAAEAAKKAKATFDALHGQVGRWVETASLTPQPHAPDPAQRFVARHAASAWRDDVLALTVSDGLLSTSESKSTGQATGIVLNLVKSIAALGTGVSPPPTRRTQGLLGNAEIGRAPAPKDDCKAYDLAVVFDPTDPQDWDRVRARLKAARAQVILADLSAADAPAPGTVAAAPTTPVDGLVYRAPRRMTLEIAVDEKAEGATGSACKLDGPSSPARLTVTVPDSRTRFVLPVTGSAMAKSSIKHVFKDGMLTELSLDQPSTLAAVAGLPVDILKALVSVPAELIKLRVDVSSQEKAEIDGQVKLIEAQIALMKAQRDLQAAQDAAAKP